MGFLTRLAFFFAVLPLAFFFAGISHPSSFMCKRVHKKFSEKIIVKPFGKKVNSKSGPKPCSVMTVSMEDFKKLDLRVGLVVKAERVKGSERLLRLSVDFGGVRKQVLTGLAQLYPPEHFIGRHLVFITNLEPRKIRGELSEAMLLTAVESEERVVPVIPETPVKPGTPIY